MRYLARHYVRQALYGRASGSQGLGTFLGGVILLALVVFLLWL